MSIKVLNNREFEKIVRKNGYKYISCKGDHKKFRRDSDKTIIIISKNINRMIVQRLTKEHNLVW